MLSFYYTNNFQNSLYEILKPYDSKKANILLSGGSIPVLFNSKDINLINGCDWEIYLADERITDDENDMNITAIRSALNQIKCKIHNLKLTSKIPSIDLAILSIGEDGHIASLFPNHSLLDSDKEIIYIDDSPKLPPKRVSVGIKILNKCRKLVFMLPPKNGVVKEIEKPHESILKRIVVPFDVYLDMSLKK